MSDKAIEAIAGYLAEVDLDPVEWWHRPARGILAALKAAGIEVVELPNDSGLRPVGDSLIAIHTLNVVDTPYQEESGEIDEVDVTVRVSAALGITSILEINSPDGLRALAASILAFANTAEGALL